MHEPEAAESPGEVLAQRVCAMIGCVAPHFALEGHLAHRSYSVGLGFLLFAAPFFGGCGAADVEAFAEPPEELGSVRFELTSVPSGIACIRVTAAPVGGTATSKTFAVAGGSSSVALDMGRLPAGETSFTGEAFNVACASIGTTAALWDAAATAKLQRGVISTVQLDFRKSNPVTVVANFVGNIRKIAAGDQATYIATDVGVYRAGTQLSGANQPQFLLDNTMTDVIDLAAGAYHACAVRADGTVWCWGHGGWGQLGHGSNGSSTLPVRAGTLSGMTAVAAGFGYSCATGASGTWCWGENHYGQLGNGGTTPSNVPVSTNAYHYRSIAARSAHTLAVTNEGRVFGWGSNHYRQVVDTATVIVGPQQLSNFIAVQGVAAGRNFSCVNYVDGSARCWGQNSDGQLGDGTTVSSPTPKTVTGLGGEVAQLAAGDYHVCARLSSNQIKCWGYADFGRLGDRANVNRSLPVSVYPQFTARTIAVGEGHACGLTDAFELYCWGKNSDGQLGNGTVATAYAPTKVPLLP
jgi:alpha-tubulin suppressor-like RCC1 family protein